MKKWAAVLLALGVIGAVACAQVAPSKPKVLQGTVRGYSGSLLLVSVPGDTVSNGRQVDISGATFENSAGKIVPRFALKANDRVVIVVDPKAPTVWRPKPQPGHPMPMIIRLLPLKALVVKRA
jgi:hypothetical protein